jgi:uncharacterized phage protein gp47/JayE
MYEDMTFEVILQRMLDRVPTIVDKREGSIIYDALAPAAVELAMAYVGLETILNQAFSDKASGEYLDRKAAEIGIKRNHATFSAWKASFKNELGNPFDVSIGSRFSVTGESVVLKVVEKLEVGVFKLISETLGATTNIYTNYALIPIDTIANLASATLTELLIPGEDEDDDESLRKRMSMFINQPPQDGNSAQYKKWAVEYDGIGNAKVFPLWNGGNTVKIAICDAEFKPANGILVAAFQEYIDPGSEGIGNGVAPIGSKVTVTGGTAKNINLSANVILADGYSVAVGAAEAVARYFASIAYVKNSVSYMRVGGALLDCDSILEISNLTINSGIVDIPLVNDEIPVLNSISLVVIK